MNDHLKVVLDEASTNETRDVYQLVGEMDKAGLDLVRSDVAMMVDKFGKDLLVFGCEDLKFINSEGIGFLMEIHAHLVKHDKNLVIYGVRDNVMEVFEAIGLGKVVKVYKDLKEV